MNIAKLLRIGLPALAVLLAAGIVLSYVAGRGKLAVTLNGEGEYTYYSLDAGKAERQKNRQSGNHTVPSGNYTVEYTYADGAAIKYLSVPGFFGTAETSFTNKSQNQVERIATQTSERLAVVGNTIFSTSSTHEAPVVSFARNQPLQEGVEIEQPVATGNSVISNEKLIGLQNEADRGVDNTSPVFIYDFAANKAAKTSKRYNFEGQPFVLAPSVADRDLFGVQYTENDKEMLDIFSEGLLAGTHDISAAAATEDGNAVTFNGNYMAYGIGNASTDEHDVADDERLEVEDYIIEVYAVGSQTKAHAINIGKKSALNLSITADGRYVAAVQRDSIHVYDTGTGDEVFAAELPVVSSLQWLDNNRLVALSAIKGLYIINANEASAQSVFNNASLRISDFTVDGQRIYFTAFTNAAGFETSSRPDAYVAYLDREATDGNSTINKLPYRSNTFYATAFGRTIFVQSQVAPTNQSGLSTKYHGIVPVGGDYKRDAQQYIEKNIKDYQQYTVVYDQTLR